MLALLLINKLLSHVCIDNIFLVSPRSSSQIAEEVVSSYFYNVIGLEKHVFGGWGARRLAVGR